MKEFKGDIIITDPCYFAKDADWGDSFDYKNLTIDNEFFHNYIWKPTGTGDGMWPVLSTNKILGQIELENHINKVIDLINKYQKESTKSNFKNLQSEFEKETVLGDFCVDSGTVGVFYLDEVLNYNPSFLADVGDWCYCIIPDFKGLVDFDPAVTGSEAEDCRDFCIKGIGNITFYTR